MNEDPEDPAGLSARGIEVQNHPRTVQCSRCDHERRFHDPCSKCGCKTFVEPHEVEG